MRVRSSDDGYDHIMSLSEALDLADDETYQPPENEMVTKKTTTDKEVKTTEVKTKAPVAKKAATEPKGVFGPRPVPEGYVGLTALAEEVGLKPAVCRRKLRVLGGKPEGQHGWYWKEGSKDLAAVRKALAAKE